MKALNEDAGCLTNFGKIIDNAKHGAQGQGRIFSYVNVVPPDVVHMLSLYYLK